MTFGNSQLNFLQNSPPTVGQVVMTYMKLWLGEWYLDTSQGVPYPLGILGKYTQAEADSMIQDQILSVQGVTEISSYSSTINPVTRSLRVTVTINTLYGQTTLQNLYSGAY